MADPKTKAAKPAIHAQGLGVRFNRNRRRHRSIRELLTTGKTGVDADEFWALRDVSFEVAKGEAVGLVGANGSGKSTLLKMVAGVMIPDEGSVRVRGDVAPLIEVTGGFIGDLTARDNIWLTGGLHGLSKAQIAERFDDIVEWAGVGDFLDTPFRHFSSGMKVRLGFSVVTQLDGPIMIIDEVFAVGDRKFKEKCYARLEERIAEGRTLFVVSHSENDLRRFCTRGLYMNKGRLKADGELGEVIDQYNADSDAGRT
jgi:ABC-2 type transport system ATP-binding protein